MFNINTLFLFIFIFSILTITRNFVKIISAVLQEIPEKVHHSNTALISNGLALSYILTYIIQTLL
jgi:hypothetical protein